MLCQRASVVASVRWCISSGPMETKRDANSWPCYAQLVVQKLEREYKIAQMDYFRCRKGLSKLQRERRRAQREASRRSQLLRKHTAANPRLQLCFGHWRRIYTTLCGYVDEQWWLKFRDQEKCRRAAQSWERHQRVAKFWVW